MEKEKCVQPAGSMSEEERQDLPDRTAFYEEYILAKKIADEYTSTILQRENFWHAVQDGDYKVNFKKSDGNTEWLEIRGRNNEILFYENLKSMGKLMEKFAGERRPKTAELKQPRIAAMEDICRIGG